MNHPPFLHKSYWSPRKIAGVTVALCVMGFVGVYSRPLTKLAAEIFIEKDTVEAASLIDKNSLAEQQNSKLDERVSQIEQQMQATEQKRAQETQDVQKIIDQLNQSNSTLTAERTKLEQELKRVASLTVTRFAQPVSTPLLSPVQNETPAPAQVAPTIPSESKKIHINTATLAELDGLPGIGSTYAERIIEYRKTHGNFKTLEEIKEVKGIGDALFTKIKDLITL